MESYDYLIIGGGAAGTAAAETIRQTDQSGSVAIVSDEIHPLYSRVMLSKPNFFLGKIPFDTVFMKGEQWYAENRVAFLGGKSATALDGAKKVVTLSDGTELQYGKLLLALGVSARQWTVAGAGRYGVHYLRTLDQAKGIIDHIKTAKKAIIIGGGFIGFEMADMLRLAGLEVTMILRERYFWEPLLDEPSGRMVEAALVKGGVAIIREMEVAEVLGGDAVSGVRLKDGRELSCDMIMCGIGVYSPIDWLEHSGIQHAHGIIADEYLATSIPDVWTAGDVAEYRDILLDEMLESGNWVNAREQGRVAALNMMGQRTKFSFVSFYTTVGMGITITFVDDVRPGPDRIVIPRGSPELGSYVRMLIVGKELVGATLINRTNEMSSISKLIDHNVDVSEKHKELGDPNFDLKSLITN
ncbi:MAG: hypothetical protein RL681_717 [Candidatus Parcubacteria bacterium]|jgi:NAD(P)H-nitrite reductase large subunit